MRRVALGFTGQPYSIRQIIGAARKAEASGFESVWIAEDNWTGRDSISILSSLALSTDHIRLGTLVVNPYTRHPVLIAMTLNTLSDLAADRLILGIGAGMGWKPLVASQMAERPPLRTMREAIDTIRRLLRGETIICGEKEISFTVVRRCFDGALPRITLDIPVYMGAVGPRMSELVGEIGDGLILETGTRRDEIPIRLRRLHTGAARIKRDPQLIDTAAVIVTGVSKDGKADRNTLGYAARHVALLVDAEVKKLGFDPEQTRRVREEYLYGSCESAFRALSPNMISTFTAAGNLSDCLRIIDEFTAKGVNLPILLPLGCDLDSVITLGAEYANTK